MVSAPEHSNITLALLNALAVVGTFTKKVLKYWSIWWKEDEVAYDNVGQLPVESELKLEHI